MKSRVLSAASRVLTGLLQAQSAEQRHLLMSSPEELRDRPDEPQPLPALSSAEMLGCGHVP